MEKTYVIWDSSEPLERILEEIMIENFTYETAEEAQRFIDTYSEDVAKLLRVVVVEVKEAS